jgi:hypothetical protein
MRFAWLARVFTTLSRGHETWRRMATYAVMDKRPSSEVTGGHAGH